MNEMSAHLLALTTAHVRGLGALVVDVGPQVLELRLRRRLSLLDRLVNDSLSLLVDALRVTHDVVSTREFASPEVTKSRLRSTRTLSSSSVVTPHSSRYFCRPLIGSCVERMRWISSRVR